MPFRERKQKRELREAIERGRRLHADDDAGGAEFLEDAARRFPGCAEFPLLLSNFYLKSRPGEVAALVAKAAELGFDDPATQVRAGHKFLNDGSLEAARTCADRAGELADDDFALMAALEGLSGRIASLDGDFTAAEEKLRSAVAREPEYAVHALHLARFLWARDRDEDALSVIDESLGKTRNPEGLEQLRRQITTKAP